MGCKLFPWTAFAQLWLVWHLSAQSYAEVVEVSSEVSHVIDNGLTPKFVWIGILNPLLGQTDLATVP